MSTAATQDVLRPQNAFKNWLFGWALACAPFVFRLLRAIRPILRIGNRVVVTRYDDVREVFLNDRAFRVPYRDKLDIIMGNQPFFLSMDDTPDYRRDTAAMRKVVLQSDIAERLVPQVEQLAQHIVGAANGRLEVVEHWCDGSPLRCWAHTSGYPTLRMEISEFGQRACSNSSSRT
jgi:cytochrome P450